MRCKWELSSIKVVKWNNEPLYLIMRRIEQVFHVEHFSSAPGALMFPSSGDSPARVFHVEHSYGADLPKEEAARPEV
jgi:hypothetical protein